MCIRNRAFVNISSAYLNRSSRSRESLVNSGAIFNWFYLETSHALGLDHVTLLFSFLSCSSSSNWEMNLFWRLRFTNLFLQVRIDIPETNYTQRPDLPYRLDTVLLLGECLVLCRSECLAVSAVLQVLSRLDQGGWPQLFHDSITRGNVFLAFFPSCFKTRDWLCFSNKALLCSLWLRSSCSFHNTMSRDPSITSVFKEKGMGSSAPTIRSLCQQSLCNKRTKIFPEASWNISPFTSLANRMA